MLAAVTCIFGRSTDAWTFEVADHAGQLPSNGFHHSDGLFREGKYPNAGWMPYDVAVALIEQCLREYRVVEPKNLLEQTGHAIDGLTKFIVWLA